MAHKSNTLTQGRLQELLHYDHETGDFTWLVKRGTVKPGDAACTVQSAGYISIGVDGGRYLAHRLAWLYVTGEWPGVIDHIDRNPTNNAFRNLRSVDQQRNLWNTRTPKTNKTGAKGVSMCRKSGKFYACIRIDGKSKNLGLYERIEDAEKAYQRAVVEREERVA